MAFFSIRLRYGIDYIKQKWFLSHISHPNLDNTRVAIVRGATSNRAGFDGLLRPLDADLYVSKKEKVPRAGIEPATPAFSVLCSTN
jgi:hypothetical protein